MLLEVVQLSVTGCPALMLVGFAVKLEMVGDGPLGTFAGVKIVPCWTTSKFAAVMDFRRLRLVLFQRESGAPLMKMALPLSARIIPYFFNAARIT